ncbi:MAG TPA: tetratricopeptide repeat protein [Actinopolymorphaceae bacterium]
MTGQSFSRPGAVDLSKLAASGAESGAAQPPSGGASGQVTGQYVVDVTEETFQQEVVERSISVPVVIDFWADWCQPCKQLSPILERLSDEYAGRFVLAKIDTEANPRIAQAANVQSIPLVMAVLRGQIVPLFQGAVPEAQVRQAIDQVLQVAVANGISGTAQPVSPGRPTDGGAAAPARDPRYAEADAAIERGDLDAAVAAFEKILDQSPADVEAKQGLARARLLQRTRPMNAAEVRTAAAERPDDPAAQIAAADLDVVGGHVVDAFDRLVGFVRRSSGADRDAVRLHLLELFDVVGADDPRVRKARQQLSAALF